MLATTSLDARRSKSVPVLPATWRLDTVFLLALAFWVVASRLPYLNDFDMMGKDGPVYIGGAGAR